MKTVRERSLGADRTTKTSIYTRSSPITKKPTVLHEVERLTGPDAMSLEIPRRPQERAGAPNDADGVHEGVVSGRKREVHFVLLNTPARRSAQRRGEGRWRSEARWCKLPRPGLEDLRSPESGFDFFFPV